jgi:hypothetical protein
MTTFIHNNTFVSLPCTTCGVEFAISYSCYDVWRKDGNRKFTCPNNHQNYFLVGKTGTQIALDKANARIAELNIKITELQTELDHYNKNPNLSIVVGATAPLEKRIQELENELEIWRPRQVG